LRSVEHKPVQVAWRGGVNGTASIPGKKGGGVAKDILIEEFRLTVLTPRDLPGSWTSHGGVPPKTANAGLRGDATSL
jgi:hypothetical protein